MCRWHGDSSSMRVFTRPHCCPPRSSRALRRAWQCQALEAAHALWPAYLGADLAGLNPLASSLSGMFQRSAPPAGTRVGRPVRLSASDRDGP